MSQPSDTFAFWSAIRTVASTFRQADPQLTGTLRDLVACFSQLPREQQVQLRHDVQLLTVQFPNLALAMTNRLDASMHGTPLARIGIGDIQCLGEAEIEGSRPPLTCLPEFSIELIEHAWPVEGEKPA